MWVSNGWLGGHAWRGLLSRDPDSLPEAWLTTLAPSLTNFHCWLAELMLLLIILLGPPSGRDGVEKLCIFFALKDLLGLENFVVISD